LLDPDVTTRSPYVQRTEIDALTGLRGVAALWVFFFHVANMSDGLNSAAHPALALLGAAGFLGVDVFFVLSGFVLAYNYGSHDLHCHPRLYRQFLSKRLARIYPVHVAALILVLVTQAAFALHDMRFMPASRLSLEGLLASLTLTHGWAIPIQKTWNTVSWSISCEWAAYLAFPLIAWAAGRVTSRLLLGVLLVLIYASLALILDSGDHEGTLAYGLPRIAAGFTAGVLLHRLWMLHDSRRSDLPGWLAFATLLVLIPVGNWVAAVFGKPTAMVYLTPLSCVVVYGLAAGRGPIVRVLSTRGALFAGRISYSFYMLHGLALAAFAVALRGTGIATPEAAMFAIAAAALIVVTAAAIALHKFVEAPAQQLMVGYLARSNARRTVGGAVDQPW
jgi:peptidoglycan/LPS O-acetylase OafA/YrhL